MKFCRKDLGNKEKYDELNVFLTEKINENPLETAKIIKYRFEISPIISIIFR